MNHFFKFGLSTPKGKDKLSLDDIANNVKETVYNFIDENKIAPDVVRVIITCTSLQFKDIVKRAFYGSVDALYAIANKSFRFYMPTLDVSLMIILDPLPDKGPMRIRTICENQLIPNIISEEDATSTNVNYQSIEPYFNKGRLHFIAREFNPDINKMIIRWKFAESDKMSSTMSFRININNPGIRFKENHESEYILSGNEDHIIIKGAKSTDAQSVAGYILHINELNSSDTLLDIKYNYLKGFWEYKICRDTTIIDGKTEYARDIFIPMEDSLKITIDGIAMNLEPIGSPKIKE